MEAMEADRDNTTVIAAVWRVNWNRNNKPTTAVYKLYHNINNPAFDRELCFIEARFKENGHLIEEIQTLIDFHKTLDFYITGIEPWLDGLIDLQKLNEIAQKNEKTIFTLAVD